MPPLCLPDQASRSGNHYPSPPWLSEKREGEASLMPSRNSEGWREEGWLGMLRRHFQLIRVKESRQQHFRLFWEGETGGLSSRLKVKEEFSPRRPRRMDGHRTVAASLARWARRWVTRVWTKIFTSRLCQQPFIPLHSLNSHVRHGPSGDLQGHALIHRVSDTGKYERLI